MQPSFCRVTGNSRNLPKPNYFPLLPAISPVEARRLRHPSSCGPAASEYHLYIPVIEFGRESRAVLCHITANESGEHHYQPELGPSTGQVQSCRITAKHLVNPEHRYIFPVLDASVKDRNTEQLRSLLRRMKRLSQTAEEKGDQYVYTLDDDHLNVVVPANMEEAIRLGDIENLHLSKSGQVAVVRIKNGPSVTLNMHPLDAPNESSLFQGRGQDGATLERQRRVRDYKKRKGFDSFMGFRRRYFEEKDKENQREEIIVDKKMKEAPEQLKVGIISEEMQVLDEDWHSRMSRLEAGTRAANKLLAVGNSWKDLISPDVGAWEWDSLPKQEEIPQNLHVPEVVPPVSITIDKLIPGFLPSDQANAVSDDTVGFETVPVFESIRPSSDELPAEMAQDLLAMEPAGLEHLKDVFADLESIMFLPFIHEVEDVTQALDAGIRGRMVRTTDGIRFVASDEEGRAATEDATEMTGEENTISVLGAMVPLENEQRFVVGKRMKDNLVPGRATGEQFTAGITVQTPEGVGFIPGLIFDCGSRKRFSAGEFIKTDSGRQFVSGQALPTLLGPKFIPGQTIRTGQGLKFTAGQKNSVDGSFISGQVLPTASGAEFVMGTTFDTPQGARFIPGRVTADGRDFVPGQTIDGQFTAGETVDTPDGPFFIPGLNIETAGEVKFHPGRNIAMPDGKVVFVPGETVVSSQMDARQFIAGCILETEKGHKFVPCRVDESGLHPATKEEEVFSAPGLPDGLPIDNSTFSAVPWKKPDIGYMIQHEERVKFLPQNQAVQQVIHQAETKAVPGQLLELHNLGPKFIPGKMIETALGSRFIPGQIVKTNRGEQFVPGQVVESKQGGPKFFPGQVVETRHGKRFVPGQVFESRKGGPRFVPGKILHTNMGSTFIPGQVVYTDVGSRFLPGQVMDTSAGPYFVPGAVVEKEQSIRFVAGEIIETDDGPRYVVHETDDSIDDGEIRVQAFQVSPEELRLITAYPFPTLHTPLLEEPMINSRMLRQMAAAGIAVTKHTAGKLQEAIISAPNDHDDAILGANVFREKDPVFEQKPRKDPSKAPAKPKDPPPPTDKLDEGTPVPSPLENNVVDIDGICNRESAQNSDALGTDTPAESGIASEATTTKESSAIPSTNLDEDVRDQATMDALAEEPAPPKQQIDLNEEELMKLEMLREQELLRQREILEEEENLKQEAIIREREMLEKQRLELLKQQEILKQQEMLRQEAIQKEQEMLKEQELLRQQAIQREQEMLKEQELLRQRALEMEQAMLKEQELLKQQAMLKEQERLKMQQLFEEEMRQKEQEIMNEDDPAKRAALLKEQEMLKQNALLKEQELQKELEKLEQEALQKEQDMLREKAMQEQQALLRQQEMMKEQEMLRQQALQKEQEILKQQQLLEEQEKLKLLALIKEQEMEKENERLKEEQNLREQDLLRQQEILRQQELLRQQEKLREQAKLKELEAMKQQALLNEQLRLREQRINQEKDENKRRLFLEEQEALRQKEELLNQQKMEKEQAYQKEQEMLKEQALKEQARLAKLERLKELERLKQEELLHEQELENERLRQEALLREQAAAKRREFELQELLRKQEFLKQQEILREQEALRQAAFEVSKRAKRILSVSEIQNASVLENLSLGRILSSIFRRIGDDPGVIESDADIGETLAAAVGWAEALGLTKLAEKIRLLDLQAMDDDPQVVQHMKDVIRLRSLAQDEPEVLELFELIVNHPTAMTAQQIQQAQAYISGADQTIPAGPGDPTGRDFFSEWSTSRLLFTGQCQITAEGSFRWTSNRRKASLSADLPQEGITEQSATRYKKPPRSRRVQSRSSSRLCIPVDLCEEDELESASAIPAQIINDDALPNCIIPPVISSAKDISKDVIDTLRYSNDDSLKEFYTQKILEAVGCAPSNSPERDDHPPISRSRKESACIILKDFLQTIVPRDAAHSVLVGEIDYMIIDDDGVRYFESASGFASRRSSRYDIRQSQRSASSSRRNSRDDSIYDPAGPYPWADVAPHGSGRRVSIDEFRKKMFEGDALGMEGRRSRAASTERHSRQRHSFAGFAPNSIGRSSSGYSTPVAARSRRGSVDDVGIFSAIGAMGAMGRKRKVAGLPDDALAGIRSRMQNMLPDSF